MLPPGFSNMYKSLVRYNEEGYRTRGGLPIYTDPTAGELTAQFFGFTPANYISNQEEGLIKAKVDRNLTAKKSAILKDINKAAFLQDDNAMKAALAAKNKFNKKYGKRFPKALITLETMKSSRQSYNISAMKSVNGVVLSDITRRVLTREINLDVESREKYFREFYREQFEG